jgi:hypothetical protein
MRRALAALSPCWSARSSGVDVFAAEQNAGGIAPAEHDG